ncbi:hypothetical protein [Chryseobacterium arthrosphaerae]|uniref:hypothetical protein n=1 Tax=Chryseobacterium arthrosphaerae TaxID=651561 RepID=UPI001E496CE6|nr:hypothetical protein [Chryseobacterium arthrosphaerae]UEQ77250.1 hypothetical protein J8N07_02790 [Chryseobacterium arthrosphaerae]
MELIECSSHGAQPFGVVCIHLLTNEKKSGFHEQEDEGHGKPDAWCNECHERWQLMNQSEVEREQWEELCDFKMICAVCYDKIKEEHQTVCDIDLEVTPAEQLKDQLVRQQCDVILTGSLPSWLPDLYIQTISDIATQVISVEAKLLSIEEAVNINQNQKRASEWVFATSTADDYWTFDDQQNIIYYEQIDEELVSQKMNIHFDQWLQLCFLLQKLDRIQEKYLITIALQKAMQQSLYTINPVLADHFENII